MLIDTKGPRIALILAASLCTVGQAVFGTAGFFNIWGVMLAGRTIFGLGGEVLHAAQHTIISRWFKASQLSVIFHSCVGCLGNLY
jgi:MFS family permease